MNRDHRVHCSTPHRAVWLVALASLIFMGCETEVLWVDPPVSYHVEHQNCGAEDDLEQLVELGIYEEQLFTPFDKKNEAPITPGTQGGTWCMPAVRTQGIQNPIRVRATITTESGEMVGVTVVNSIRMKVAPGGDCELLTLPIPIQHQANPKAPIKDLYGLKAKMSIEVESKTKDGGKATTTSNVVLVKG